MTQITAPPLNLIVHQTSRQLEIVFANGQPYRIAFELLRVYSPSAEVQGHGPGQEVLQTGKREVLLTDIEAVGNYGIKPRFSDGHDTGIYTWSYLYELATGQEQLWADYERRLKTAGIARDAPMPAPATGCGHQHQHQS